MGWLIISLVILVALFVLLGVKVSENKELSMGKYKTLNIEFKRSPKQLLSLFALLLVIPGFIAYIPANTVGIIFSPFNGTSNVTLSEGVSSKNLFDKIYRIPTETQTMTLSDLTTQTKDSQYVISSLDVKYKVNRANAYLIFTQYRTLDRMSDALIAPTTQKALELVTTNYNVIDILGEKKSNVYSELDVRLSEEFAKYGVEFVSISITDMNAGENIEAAIEAEAVAKKAVETAEQELLKAETEAKKKSVVAQAEQDAAKIEAETKIIKAEADQKANQLLQQSLTDELLEQQWIQKWNGVAPTYYGGNGADLIFNTGTLQ